MYEVNKKIAAIIDKSAEKLPDLYHETEKEWAKIHGSILVDKYGMTTLPTGELISYDEFYSIEVPKKINHRFLLKKVYQKDGLRGIVDYCKVVRKIMQNATH